MSLNEDFEAAAAAVQTLSRRPDNDTLLTLYSLYKQGTEGDVQGQRPGMLDIKGRKKYDAWAALKGKDSTTAKEEYVALVKQLQIGDKA